MRQKGSALQFMGTFWYFAFRMHILPFMGTFSPSLCCHHSSSANPNTYEQTKAKAKAKPNIIMICFCKTWPTQCPQQQIGSKLKGISLHFFISYGNCTIMIDKNRQKPYKAGTPKAKPPTLDRGFIQYSSYEMLSKTVAKFVQCFYFSDDPMNLEYRSHR